MSICSMITANEKFYKRGEEEIMKKMRKILAFLLSMLLIAGLGSGVSAASSPNNGKYDPHTEGIVSAYYPVDSDHAFITGIAPGTTAQQLQKVCLPGNMEVSREILATGTVLSVQTAADETHSLTAIVTGDLNGDGSVSITDMLMLKSKILGQNLPDTALAAGDINYDGSVTITDFLRIKACLLGLERISAGRTAQQPPTEQLLLLTPESSLRWMPGVSAAAYMADDQALVSLASDGTVTAGTQEGTTFVYALDEAGNVLARTVVTVLQEKLSVSLDASQYRLLEGYTHKLSACFNHPLHPAVTWTSSDPTVVSVDENGLLTAHKCGIATVVVSLENGSRAEASVSVIPPITGLETEKSLYKIKPGSSREIPVVITPADVEEEFLWTSSDPAVVTVADGTVTGIGYGIATVTATGKYSGLTVSCEVKVCDVKQVAITFDDGPSIHTVKLLDYLQEKDIQATFFLVGDRMTDYSATVKRQVAEGHEIGYHSYSHIIQTGLSSEKIISDFEKSDQILEEMTGAHFTVWRTPGGGYSDRVLQCVPLPHILWSVDTNDWKLLNSYKVYRAIVSQARDGSIILLHDLYSSSVNGAIMAMDEMLAGDYEFVTVTELLSRDGTPPEPSKTYYSG